MNKFLITSSDATKDNVTKALSDAHLECTVEQHAQDCFLVEIRSTDLPESRSKFSQEENMSFIAEYEAQFKSSCVDLLKDDDEDDEATDADAKAIGAVDDDDTDVDTDTKSDD